MSCFELSLNFVRGMTSGSPGMTAGSTPYVSCGAQTTSVFVCAGPFWRSSHSMCPRFAVHDESNLFDIDTTIWYCIDCCV